MSSEQKEYITRSYVFKYTCYWCIYFLRPESNRLINGFCRTSSLAEHTCST